MTSVLHFRPILLLLFPSRLPCLQYPLLPLHHHIHMLNKRCIFLVPFNHRQRIDRIYERAVSGIGGSARFLHDARLAGGFFLRALGDGGKESIFFRL